MRILVPILTLLALLLSACTGADRSVLEQADAIMEERPDSALAILRSIDRSRLADGDLPYYALLMTQAQVKNDIPLDSDSLISIAYAEYEDAWRGDKGIRSAFYLGEVFFNQDRPREAMRQYLSAFEDSKRLGNEYWHAKSAERIADLFFNACNYEDESEYRKEAIEYYGLCDKPTNQRYAITDLATIYINASRYDEAIILLDSVYDTVLNEEPENQFLQDYIRRARVDAMVSLGRIHDLKEEDLDLLEHSTSTNLSFDNNILKLQIESIENSKGGNDELMRSIRTSAHSDEEKALALYACYEYLRSRPDKHIELKLVDSLLFYQNAVAESIIQQSVKDSERDFYADQAIKNRKKARLQGFITLIVVLLVGIAVVVLGHVIRLRNRAHRSELEAQVEALVNMKVYSDKVSAERTALRLEINDKAATLNVLRQKVDTQDSIINKLGQEALDSRQLIEDIRKEQDETRRHLDNVRHMLDEKVSQHQKDLLNMQKEYAGKNESRNIIMESLFRTKWSSLNRLCEEYYEKGALKMFREMLVKDIEAEVRNIGSKDGLRQIEEEVNRYLDGMIEKLRTECDRLNEKDIALCSLIFAGFSVKAICFILDITTNNYYVRKKRLIQKITDSHAQNVNLFLSRL